MCAEIACLKTFALNKNLMYSINTFNSVFNVTPGNYMNLEAMDRFISYAGVCGKVLQNIP